MQQFRWQLAQWQMHGPDLAVQAGLGGKEMHRVGGGALLVGGDERLHQRRQNRIKPDSRLKASGQLRLQRQRVNVGQQSRHLGQRARQPGDGRVFGRQRGIKTVGNSYRMAQLARQVGQRGAHPGNDFFGKQRGFVRDQQMAQHGGDPGHSGIIPRQGKAQFGFGRVRRLRISRARHHPVGLADRG